MAISKQTQEQEAKLSRIVDSALLFINAADSKASGKCPVTVAHSDIMGRFSWPHTKMTFKEVFSALGYGWSSGCLYASDNSTYHSRLAEVEDLQLAERRKLKSLGVISSSFQRVVKLRMVEIAQNGQCSENSTLFEVNWESRANPFMPIGVSPRRVSTRMRFTRTQWVEEEELTHGTVTAIPLIAADLALAFKTSWIVQLGNPGLTPIALATDACGIKALFRLRDVPDGMTRRAALLHWVREHMRKTRNDPEVEAQVRGHLRGRVEFDWFGLQGKIVIPDVNVQAPAIPVV